MKTFCLYIIIAVTLNACTSKKQQAQVVFNEGVTLNLQALAEIDKGAAEKAKALNKQALKKFEATLKIDPAHKGALISLAHAYYLEKQYQQAINYYQKGLKTHPDLAYFANKEMADCQNNLMQLKDKKITAEAPLTAE